MSLGKAHEVACLLDELLENNLLFINMGDDKSGWYTPLSILSVYSDGDALCIDLQAPEETTNG